MKQTGQISSINCVHFRSYSVKYINIFIHSFRLKKQTSKNIMDGTFKAHVLHPADRCRERQNGQTEITQPGLNCSKLTIETLEQGVKYVQI